MVPDCEKDLSLKLDPLFKVYRDDGLGVTFADKSVIVDILDYFNNYNDKIQWTIPICPLCSQPEVTCIHYTQLDFLDVSITWKQVPKDGILIWQFQTKAYAKPTDVHAYLHPTSCTSPHLNSQGVAVSKTVGTRLRTTHSNDQALLEDLNLYSGYLISRGYNPESVKMYLSDMANRSRDMLLTGAYKKEDSFVMPLVTSLHPATTVLTPAVRKAFKAASSLDPALSFILPSSSIVVAYRRLPNLQLLICKNDQNSLASSFQRPKTNGYTDTGCRCLLCKASTFGTYAVSPAMPGYRVNIQKSTNCRSGPGVVYHARCNSGRKECSLAHYVGRAFTSDPDKFPMRLRWTTHKSHFKHNFNGCKLTEHLLTYHKGEDAQNIVKVMILDTAESLEEVLKLELIWTRKLFAFWPSGLNIREEESLD